MKMKYVSFIVLACVGCTHNTSIPPKQTIMLYDTPSEAWNKCQESCTGDFSTSKRTECGDLCDKNFGRSYPTPVGSPPTMLPPPPSHIPDPSAPPVLAWPATQVQQCGEMTIHIGKLDVDIPKGGSFDIAGAKGDVKEYHILLEDVNFTHKETCVK